MNSDYRGPCRQFDAESIFSPEFKPPRAKILWHTKPEVKNGIADPENEELIQIMAREINIVSSRDVRRSVQKSMEISVDLAAAGERVLYINTYAGIGMLRDRLADELERYPDLIQIPPELLHAPSERPEFPEDENTEDDEEWEVPEDDDENDGYSFEVKPDYKPKNEFDFKERIRIIDCKMGMWEPCSEASEKAMEQILYESRKYPIKSKVLPAVDVVILNSYEFAAIDYRTRMQLVTDLLEWQHKYRVTVVLFTQQANASMQAGLPVRGPLGLLTAYAATIAKIDMPMRKSSAKIHENKPQVHDQTPNTAIKLYYDQSGTLAAVIYPKDYKAHRYEFGFFPQWLLDAIPEGIDAVQLIGEPTAEEIMRA